MRIPGLRYAVLGSGSTANSYIFEHEDFSFIIDNGFSAKKALTRAEGLGFDPDKIGLILLTHHHQDHLKGIEVLSRRVKAPVGVHHQLNLNPWLKSSLYKRMDIVPGKFYSRDNFRFLAFPTAHDAAHSVSYSFMLGRTVFSLISDTGYLTPQMKRLAAESDILFLESNYDREMLEAGPYPAWLKKRITSPLGHLSNHEALDFLNGLGQSGNRRLKEVYFCHLSSTNNDPQLLEQTLRRGLNWKGQYTVCPKGEIQEAL